MPNAQCSQVHLAVSQEKLFYHGDKISRQYNYLTTLEQRLNIARGSPQVFHWHASWFSV